MGRNEEIGIWAGICCAENDGHCVLEWRVVEGEHAQTGTVDFLGRQFLSPVPKNLGNTDLTSLNNQQPPHDLL